MTLLAHLSSTPAVGAADRDDWSGDSGSRALDSIRQAMAMIITIVAMTTATIARSHVQQLLVANVRRPASLTPAADTRLHLP